MEGFEPLLRDTWTRSVLPPTPQTPQCEPLSHSQGSAAAAFTPGEGAHPGPGNGDLRGQDALCPGAGEARVAAVGEELQGPEVLQVSTAARNASVQRETVLHLQPKKQHPGRYVSYVFLKHLILT